MSPPTKGIAVSSPSADWPGPIVELLIPRDAFRNLPKAITLKHGQKLAVQHQTSFDWDFARPCAELFGATVSRPEQEQIPRSSEISGPLTGIPF